MRFTMISTLAATMAMTAAAPAAAAGLLGQTVYIDQIFTPNPTSRTTAVVGAGIERILSLPDGPAYLSIDIDDDLIIFRSLLTGRFVDAPFNGVRIRRAAEGPLPVFASLTEVGSPDFDIRTSHDFGDLYFDWANSRIFAGATATYRVGFGEVAPIPEPASWAMMIAGFALVGGAARRRIQPVAA